MVRLPSSPLANAIVAGLGPPTACADADAFMRSTPSTPTGASGEQAAESSVAIVVAVVSEARVMRCIEVILEYR
jgi:hypothetical protein